MRPNSSGLVIHKLKLQSEAIRLTFALANCATTPTYLSLIIDNLRWWEKILINCCKESEEIFGA